MSCHYCESTTREMRPYGPGGADVCHPCMTATPEREANAERIFGGILDASPVVAISDDMAPVPYDARTRGDES